MAAGSLGVTNGTILDPNVIFSFIPDVVLGRGEAMRRRDFIALLSGVAGNWPLAARAQQAGPMRRIAVLMPFAENDPEAQANITVFREALQKLDWSDGRNVRIDYRWGGSDPDRIRGYVIELVGLKPDVILVSTAQVLQPLRQETGSIPIVFTQLSEPVQNGFVASLAHPGGNITGFTTFEASIWGKALEVLEQVAPQVARVAVILNPDQAPQAGMLRAVEDAAPPLGVTATATPVHNAAEIERAIDVFARDPNGGLIVLPNGPTVVHRELIIALAARHRLPAIYPFRHFVEDGGLICYGNDLADQYRGAAAYADRILRGEKPADLPVLQPTKFELVINLTTAKALGLTIPASILSLADQLIE
jgi:putative tryptophan/tyrosine transport system substrate-binding protein